MGLRLWWKRNCPKKAFWVFARKRSWEKKVGGRQNETIFFLIYAMSLRAADFSSRFFPQERKKKNISINIFNPQRVIERLKELVRPITPMGFSFAAFRIGFAPRWVVLVLPKNFFFRISRLATWYRFISRHTRAWRMPVKMGRWPEEKCLINLSVVNELSFCLFKNAFDANIKKKDRYPTTRIEFLAACVTLLWLLFQ